MTRAHGGPSIDELEALGLAAEDVLDFSVSTNPYGPADAVVRAVRAAPLAVYPDRHATVARRRLAAHLDLPARRLALGNGAADLLWGLARALVPPGSTVLVVEPTFGEWRAAVTALGARVIEWRARAEDDFALDLPAIADRAAGATAVYLCAPNVPTGAGVPAAAIAALAAAVRLLVLDQSFLLLSEAAADLNVALPDNVVVVRSLTKEHAVPGVRVGYAIAPPAVLERLEQHRPAWSTSAPAQAAAIASCGEARVVAESRERLLGDRRRLAARLAALRPVPSTTNFFLLPVADGAALRRRLLERHRILVRDCASFGLPGHVRIAARPPADADRLVEALERSS